MSAPLTEQQLGEIEPVGYFCDHSDEPFGARTHHDWEWDEENGGHTFQHQPNTISSHSSVDRGYLKAEQAERRCPRAVPVYAVDAPALLAEVARLTAELAKYVGHEPTLAEEALYAHEQQVRARIAHDVNRADKPTFAASEDPELVVKTTRAIDIRLIEMGPAAPYWVPEAGDPR